jgi:preprotein translocase subunit SecD
MNSAARKFLSSGVLLWVVLAGIICWQLHPWRQKLKLGIDLVGGTYITLGVQLDKAVEHELRERSATLTKMFKKQSVVPLSQKIEQNAIVMTFASDAEAVAAQQRIKDEFDDLKISINKTTVSLSMPELMINKIKQDALESNIEVLRTRMNAIGVEEIGIAAQGENRIIVELPDVDDPAKAKAMIGTPAILEFKIVEKMALSKADLLDAYDGEIPEGMIIVPGKDRDHKKYYLVSEHAPVGGQHLKNAYQGVGGRNGLSVLVNFEFTPEGGKRFRELTGQNIGRQLGIILDGKMITAPNINTEIDRAGYIEGDFNRASAQELATLLKSGAFTAPVTFEEERTIGASLGEESIRQGILACLVGLGLLFIFGVWYYRLSGFLAFIALVYNLLMILFGMYLLGATLTLPGIAGMVLTIGMAIDASILIYEKIKELLETGMPPRNAMAEGFSDAMLVILDANITTFIVGIVLFKFGTGPIKGFAATMMVGIVATLITGLFFLKSLFNALFDFTSVKKLSI